MDTHDADRLLPAFRLTKMWFVLLHLCIIGVDSTIFVYTLFSSQ
jgi:hypothetical protein